MQVYYSIKYNFQYQRSSTVFVVSEGCYVRLLLVSSTQYFTSCFCTKKCRPNKLIFDVFFPYHVQSVLGIQDLGHFYHHSIRDSNGSVILVTVRHMDVSSKSPARTSNVRWMSTEKLRRKHRCAAYENEATAYDMLFGMMDVSKLLYYLNNFLDAESQCGVFQ
jgi:hypothetical protein